VNALAVVVAATLAGAGAIALRKMRGALNGWALVPPALSVGAYAAYLYTRGYRPSFSAMKSGFAFIRDALPAGVAASLAVLGFALLVRPTRLAPWFLLLATTAAFALLAAWVGWDPTTVPPPLEGVLVFELGPAVPAAAFGALLMKIVQVRRDRLSTSAELG
jgi:hypothetical protein